MLNKIIKFLTKKGEEKNCLFCGKKFIGEEWKSYMSILGLTTITETYCSKKCDRAMDKAIKKCFNGKKLTNQEKQATKNMYYVDIPNN